MIDSIGLSSHLAFWFSVTLGVIFLFILLLVHRMGFHNGAKVWGSVFLNIVLLVYFGGTRSVGIQIILVILWPLINIFLLGYLLFRWIYPSKQ